MQNLWVDPGTELACGSFAAALIGLGVPEKRLLQAVTKASESIGLLDVHTHLEFLPDDTLAYRLHSIPLGPQEPLPLDAVSAILDASLDRAGVTGVYADLARRVLSILFEAEKNASAMPDVLSDQKASLPFIGIARTPYQDKAPYQPKADNTQAGLYYIQILPQYVTGIHALETFSHIFILSYLNRTKEPELIVQPPWKDDDKRYGVFATRSPNRPSPIGLTRTRLLHIEGSRIYTGPLDLFDGTPVLDIKPFILSLDGMSEEADTGNDGWLEGSDHLELHRLGLPHAHPESSISLYQPLVLIALLVGIGWGLQHLEVDLGAVNCVSPVTVSSGHMLDPVAQSILEQHEIPYEAGEEPDEIITPEGAALLAALAPAFITADNVPAPTGRTGVGLRSQAHITGLTAGAVRLFFT